MGLFGSRAKASSLVGMVALLLVLLVAACGTPETSSTPTPSPAAGSTPSAGATATPTPSFDPDEYFAGQTITLIVGVSPGGGYDVFSRLLARYAEKYLPDNTRFVVQNIPGGGQLTGHRILWRSEPDGLTLGPVHPRWFFAAALGEEVPDFNLDNAVFIGSPTFGLSPSGSYICVDPNRIPSWEHVLNMGTDLTIGNLAPGDGSDAGAYLIEYLGGPINVVYGYGGSAEVNVAFDRGEVMGTPYCNETQIPRLFPEFIEDGRIMPLFWWGSPPNPEYMEEIGFTGEVPHIYELEGVDISEEQQRAFDVMVTITSSTRTFMLPEGTPPEIAAFWQELFQQLMVDEEFVEAATAAGYGGDLNYGGGDDIKAAIEQATTLGPEQIEMLRALGPTD